MKKNGLKTTYMTVACVFLLSLVFVFISFVMLSETNRLSLIGAEESLQAQRIEILKNEIETVQSQISNLGLKEITAKSSIQSFENYCKQIGVDFTKTSISEKQYDEKGLVRENVKIEISGEMRNLFKAINHLQSDKQPIIVGAISLRQNNELLWLNRNIDSLNVTPWVEFEKENDTYFQNQTPEEAEQKKSEVLSKILTQDDMLCFLELSYIFTR